jgi:hypothetical protein
VAIFTTPPWAKMIMVVVCSSKGSVCGVVPRTTSVMREPCTLTGISKETASDRRWVEAGADATGRGAADGVVGLAASVVSFVSGVIDLRRSAVLPSK